MKHAWMDPAHRSIKKVLPDLPGPDKTIFPKHGSKAVHGASFQTLGKLINPVGRGTIAYGKVQAGQLQPDLAKESLTDILYSIRSVDEFSKAAQVVYQTVLEAARGIFFLFPLKFMLGKIKPPQKEKPIFSSA